MKIYNYFKFKGFSIIFLFLIIFFVFLDSFEDI